jgi:type IV fimbrial biogenesis protein FimT
MTARGNSIICMRGRGFGLIELIIALAVVAILAAAALPSFRELGIRMTVTSHTNDLVGALTMAKSEAVKRGVVAGVVGTGNDWSAGGWQVLVDANGDSTLAAGTDTVIASYPAVENQYKVTTKVTGGNDAQVVFSPLGALATPATLVDINVCRPDHQTAQSAWIEVVPSGEITSRRNTSSSSAPGC